MTDRRSLRPCAPPTGGGLGAQADVGDVDGVLLGHQALACVGEVGKGLIGPVGDHNGDVDAASSIGVDDDEFVCELSDPPLSSVAQAARRVGYEAARLLDGLLRSRRTEPRTVRQAAKPVRLVVPPIGVVARRSTDTLAVGDPEVAGAIRSIREGATRGLGIAELVTESGLSRWQLEERFRRAVGRSIHDDILHVRLEEARRLVTTTNLPMKAVAPRAGLSSVAYMTTLFRRHFGMPPAACAMALAMPMPRSRTSRRIRRASASRWVASTASAMTSSMCTTWALSLTPARNSTVPGIAGSPSPSRCAASSRVGRTVSRVCGSAGDGSWSSHPIRLTAGPGPGTDCRAKP